jgi:hypothetical protein
MIFTLWRFAAALVLSLSASLLAYAQGTTGYPAVYDTNRVLHLNMTMDPGDFSTIQNDTTFDIEVPTQFWADGDDPILVSVRRKSADPINGKVSYKVDINEYVDQRWNSLNKLSLENGDDQDVVSEGFAWYMHRVASGLPSYSPGLASWTTVTINGQSQGIYLNVEQVDKQFLRNRGLWKSGQTWLYKQDDIGLPEFEEGPTEVSPTMAVLGFEPFAPVSGKGKKNQANDPPAGWQAIVEDNINMDAMLTLGAVNAFTGNPDELFNKGKNFFWADFADGYAPANSNGERMYFPWDLDSAIHSTTASIYGQEKGRNRLEQGPYQEVLLNDPQFRGQYNQIMLDLLEGPLSVESLTSFLDEVEPILTPYLEADANSKVSGDVAGHFNGLRQWVVQRHANVLGQVLSDMGGRSLQATAVPEPSTCALVFAVAPALWWRKRRPQI